MFLILSPSTLTFSLHSSSLDIKHPDEALIESTGSQRLPHLKQTGRSYLVSLHSRPPLPPCSVLFPASPVDLSIETLTGPLSYPSQVSLLFHFDKCRCSTRFPCFVEALLSKPFIIIINIIFCLTLLKKY